MKEERRVPERGVPKSMYKLFLNFWLTLESLTQADSRRPTMSKRRVLRFKLSPIAGEREFAVCVQPSQVSITTKQSTLFREI